jgi:hypothetical protein
MVPSPRPPLRRLTLSDRATSISSMRHGSEVFLPTMRHFELEEYIDVVCRNDDGATVVERRVQIIGRIARAGAGAQLPPGVLVRVVGGPVPRNWAAERQEVS